MENETLTTFDASKYLAMMILAVVCLDLVPRDSYSLLTQRFGEVITRWAVMMPPEDRA